MKSCPRVHWLYYALVGIIVLLILAYFFKWQAAYSILPFLLILCWPLMMLMMGGHGDHAQHDSYKRKAKEGEARHAHHIM